MLFVARTGGLTRRHATQAAGYAAVAIAATTLIGMWTGLPLLSTWGFGFPTIRPVAALGLAALGLALMHPGKDSRVAFAVGLSVTAIAALVLVLALSNVGIGIINLGLPPRWALEAASTRVTSVAAIAFGLAGGSLALSCVERYRLGAIALGGLAGIIAVFALLGNLAGIHTLYDSMSVDSPPAADHRRPALHRRRDHLSDRSGVNAPQIPAVVASPAHAGMRDHRTASAVRRIRGISYRRCTAPPGSRKPDD
jgi:hypothetical protein